MNRPRAKRGRYAVYLKPKPCLGCGETFQPRERRSKYCARPCMYVAWSKDPAIAAQLDRARAAQANPPKEAAPQAHAAAKRLERAMTRMTKEDAWG